MNAMDEEDVCQGDVGSIRASSTVRKALVQENSKADLTLVTCIPRAIAALHTAEPVNVSEPKVLF